MAREDVLANIESNQNLDSSGIGSVFFLLAGNSLIDSAAVNSFAKTNSIAFQVGMETGIYANNPVFGGNFLYNIANKWGFKPKTNNWFGHINMLANEDLAKGTKLGNLVQGFADANNLNYNTEVVRGGFGFSFKKHRVIKEMHKLNNEYKPVLKVNKGASAEQAETAKKIIGKIDKKFENINDYKKYVNSLSKEEKESLKKAFSINKGVSEKAMLQTNNAIEKNLQLKTLKEIDWTQPNASKYIKKQLTSWQKSGANLKDVFDAFIDDGGKLSLYKHSTKEITPKITKEMIDEFSEQFASRYAGQTSFEKIMGSKMIRFMTGNLNLLPKGFNLPFALATAAAGITASIGQSNAVNNYITSSLYNTSDSDYYISDRSVESISSSYRISDLNLQALVSSYSNINTARRYMNDLDPINVESAENYGMDNFTTDVE